MKKTDNNQVISLDRFTDVQLTGQVRTLVVERKMLPSVSIELIISGGATQDPSGKEGLARITAQALQKGAGDYSAEKFSFAIEERGATISVYAGYESTTISGEFLSKHAEFGLEMMAAMVLDPRLASKEITLLKEKTLSNITALVDEPGQLCSLLHRSNLYEDHPYGIPVVGYPASIRSITKQNVSEAYTQKIAKAPVLLTIVGDISGEKILSHARKVFSQLNHSNKVEKHVSHKAKVSGLKFYLIDKDDQTQAHIRIGTVGIARNDPAFYRLIVTNTLFGGSFTSRLMTEVRVRRSLTYGIRSNASFLKDPGSIVIATFTKTGSVVETVDVIFNEIRSLQSEKVPLKELSGIKQYLIGLYPFSLETNKRLAQYIANLHFYNLTKSVINKYSESVSDVTQDNVLQTAQKYYSDTDAVVTILGNTKSLAPELEKQGTVISQNMSKFDI